MSIRASVVAGRLVVDEQTDLPEGTVLDLVLDDEGDNLDPSERAALERALVTSDQQARAGETREAAAILGSAPLASMTVRTTEEADGQILAVDEWWRAHRLAAPDLFLNELADAFALDRGGARAGHPWPSPGVPHVRRVLMRSTRYHVYFRPDGADVVVLAVWSAVRGRGPRL